MKKVLILAGFISIMSACNDNSDHSAANSGSSNHGAHHQTRSNTENQNDMNAI